MKDIIISCLREAFNKTYKLGQNTPIVIENEIIVDHISPKKLGEFLSENNIPDECYFDYNNSHEVIVAWSAKRDRTAEEAVSYLKINFYKKAYNLIYNTLKAKGYKRIKHDRRFADALGSTKFYIMYTTREIDSILNYFEDKFIKE